MKKYLKYGVAGLIGYFIGFYEFKYREMKALLMMLSEEEVDESEQ